MPYVKDERIRLLAVTSRERARLLPNLPTVGESYPGFQYESWFAVLGPAGIPKAIIDRVNAEMAKIIREPVVRERIEKLGIEPLAMSPDALAKLLQADYERLTKIVKLSGAVPE